MMMVPVCVTRDEHVDKAYRPPLGGVKSAAEEAFEFALRLSLTP
jgi:ribosomal protein S21